MSTGRRTLRQGRSSAASFIIGLSVLCPMLVFPALAAEPTGYPTRPIRLIVPYAPGGAVDAVGRMLAQDLSARLGQQIVVDNRAGGGGMVGFEIAARAAPDGYTLLVGSVGLASMPGLYRKLPFDPMRDFAAMTVPLTGTYLLGVNPALSAATAKELVALGRKTPGKLNFGSAGVGTTIHLAGEMLKSMAGMEIVHVPYKSAGLAMTDVIAGNIQMMFAPIVVMHPMSKAGKVRALGVSSTKRSSLAPEIPAIAETVPGFEVSGWYGLLGPAGTPRAIVERVNGETSKGVQADAFRERLKSQGLEPAVRSPEESAAFIKEDIARWSRVIRDAGIKAE